MTTVKNLLLAVCVFACVCGSAMSAELQFDVNSTSHQWQGKGPIIPTHEAILYITNVPHLITNIKENVLVESDWLIAPILSTQAGPSLSQQQKDLLSAGGIVLYKTDYVPNHYCFVIYSVSDEDARKTSQALVDALTKMAASGLEPIEQALDEIIKNRTAMEENLKQAEDFIAKSRNITTLPPDDIRKTISQMDERRNSLVIDIAGMKAKVDAITKVLADKKITPETGAKLQQTLIEQNIELAAAMAKLETTRMIRMEAEANYKDSCLLRDHQAVAQGLKSHLESGKENFLKTKENYEKVRSGIVLPQVFQNKVTIYPVSADKKVQKK